jgi:endogenous inhibitor of DNA gyrase (YacG/DUF329 family)
MSELLNCKRLVSMASERIMYGCPTCQALHEDRRNAAQTALTAIDMLKKLEFDMINNTCPYCGLHKSNGHKTDCELGNLLKEVEGK